MKGKLPPVRVTGPIEPVKGNHYRVVYRDRVYSGISMHSNPASLLVCIFIAARYNKHAKQDLAWVEFIDPGDAFETEPLDTKSLGLLPERKHST